MSEMMPVDEMETLVREEIERLRKRAAELEDRCEQLRLMNARLRDVLEIYLHADNRARRMMNSL